MRTSSRLSLSFAVLASLVAAGTASAQPALTAADTAPAPAPLPVTSVAPAAYVEGGALVGADVGILAAVSIAGGYRLSGPLWLHGELATGGLAGIDEATMSSSYTMARAGLEARRCTSNGILCAVAGADLGVRHARLEAEYDHKDVAGLVAVPRLGLDVGSEHLRFRPGVELVIDATGPVGGDLQAGVAYLF